MQNPLNAKNAELSKGRKVKIMIYSTLRPLALTLCGLCVLKESFRKLIYFSPKAEIQ